MQYFLTGSYSGVGETGVKLWQFDPSVGSLLEKAGIAGVDRPSYLAMHPTENMFIACRNADRN